MFRWKRWAVAAVILFLVNWKFVTPNLSPGASPIMGNLVITGLMLLVAASVIVELLGPHLKTRVVIGAARRLELELVSTRRNLFFTTRWVFEGAVKGVRVTIRMQYRLITYKYTDLHIWIAVAGEDGEAEVHEQLQFNPYTRDAVGHLAARIEAMAAEAGTGRTDSHD